MAVKRKRGRPRKTKSIEPEPQAFAESKSLGEKAKKAAKIIFGVLVILAGLFLIWIFLPEFIFLLKGVIGVVLVLIGIIVVALGWLD